MASPGELIDETARVLGVSRARVFSTHRYLRESGIITQGGRGTSAAKMTPRDAAALLIAVSCAQEIKDSAKTVREYWKITPPSPRGSENRIRGKTFGDAIVALLEDVPAAREWEVRVDLHGPAPHADIELRFDNMRETVPYGTWADAYDRKWRVATLISSDSLSDLRYTATFTHKALGHVGNLLRGSG